MNLSNNVKITRVMNAVGAGTGDTQNGTVLDMQGFEGVIFVAAMGAIVAGATTDLHAEQDTALAFNVDPQDLANTKVIIPADGDNKLYVLDVYKPRERYVRCAITRADQNATIDSVIAIQYGASSVPTTNGATVGVTELHVSPAEGTK